MLPSEEEKTKISDAQNNQPDTPLGTAEQFLLTISSISELEARLRLWLFTLEFETIEQVKFQYFSNEFQFNIMLFSQCVLALPAKITN